MDELRSEVERLKNPPLAELVKPGPLNEVEVAEDSCMDSTYSEWPTTAGQAGDSEADIDSSYVPEPIQKKKELKKEKEEGKEDRRIHHWLNMWSQDLQKR